MTVIPNGSCANKTKKFINFRGGSVCINIELEKLIYTHFHGCNVMRAIVRGRGQHKFMYIMTVYQKGHSMAHISSLFCCFPHKKGIKIWARKLNITQTFELLDDLLLNKNSQLYVYFLKQKFCLWTGRSGERHSAFFFHLS